MNCFGLWNVETNANSLTLVLKSKTIETGGKYWQIDNFWGFIAFGLKLWMWISKKKFQLALWFSCWMKNNGNLDHCVNCVICTQCIWDCLGHWLDQVNVSDNPPKAASEVFIIFLEVFLCLKGGFSIRSYMDLESKCWDAITSKILYILSYKSAMSNHHLKTIHLSEDGYCFIYWQAAVK